VLMIVVLGVILVMVVVVFAPEADAVGAEVEVRDGLEGTA